MNLPSNVSLRFEEHKRNAKRRGIPFNFSMGSWWSMWEPYWDVRGRGVGEKMMCRLEDTGGYGVENCYIGDASTNSKDASSYKHRAKLSLEDISDIRLLLSFKMANKDIAREYSISDAQVSRIKTGKRWAV